MKKDDYVTASEIGDYLFCRRGWWLRYNGQLKTTHEMHVGTIAHEKLAKNLARLNIKIILALIIIGIGLIILSIALVINFLV